MKAAVVTGVSSGIGRATAQLLAAEGWHIFGSVRRSEDARHLASRLGDRFTPLLFDLTNAEAIEAAARDVSAALRGRRLLGLVNNAGIAHFGPLALQPIDDWRAQIDVNLVGTLRVVQAFLPLLGSDPARSGPPGRIVNISSVSGRMTLPFASGYAASKHGLEALSDAMRYELAIFGIRTVVIQPGPVRTPIWGKVRRPEGAFYANTEYGSLFERFQASFIAAGRDAHSPESFARLVRKALTTRRPRARYTRVRHRFRNWTLPRLMPAWLVDRIVERHFGLVAIDRKADAERKTV